MMMMMMMMVMTMIQNYTNNNAETVKPRTPAARLGSCILENADDFNADPVEAVPEAAAAAVVVVVLATTAIT